MTVHLHYRNVKGDGNSIILQVDLKAPKMKFNQLLDTTILSRTYSIVRTCKLYVANLHIGWLYPLKEQLPISTPTPHARY